MNVTRLMLLLLVGLIPLAGLRELWWSDILFLKPWEAAGGDAIDLGDASDFLRGGFAALWTVVIGLFLGLMIDVMFGYLRQLTLPVLGFLALLSAIGIITMLPVLGWPAVWPLFGFTLLCVFWLHACLQTGRRT